MPSRFARGHLLFCGGIHLSIIKNIVADYEQLVKTDIQIPLNNGDVINFTFRPQDLPHLLGLQHLVDNRILFEYSQKRFSATELYNRMSGEDAINTNEFEKSMYFHDLYESRIKYFSSELILDIIQSRQIVKFEPRNVRNFETKLKKIDYMFWKQYRDKNNNYGYFGIGFMSSGKENDKNYPNTFFFRFDNEYVCNQTVVLPYSFMKRDKKGIRSFEIYWDEVWNGLHKNTHYKKLKEIYLLEDGNLDIKAIEKSENAEVVKHYELLQLDALDAIYVPYMNADFRWTNNEKRFLLQKIKEKDSYIFPGEVRQLLNEYRQKH